MAGLISLRDALHSLDGVDVNGVPERHSLKFVKMSTGEIVFVERCHKLSAKGNATLQVEPVRLKKNARKPHHFKNMTRNIVIDASGQTRKFHIRSLVEFDGKKVFF